MKKLLSMLGAIGLVATSSATVVACGNNDSDKLTNLASTSPVGTILTVYGDASDATTAGQAILNAFGVKNNLDKTIKGDLTIANFGKIGGTDKYHATIKAKDNSSVVTGEINVSVTFEQINLAEADASLIVYGDAKKAPEAKDILVAFNAKNNLSLTDKDVTITDITVDAKVATKYTATITAVEGDKLATGTNTSLTITVEQSVDLSAVKGKDLIVVGDISATPSPEAILAAFNEANGLKLQIVTDVTILDIAPSTAPKYTATITAATGSKGATKDVVVTITFDPINPIDLAIVGAKALTITGDVNAATVLKAFNEANGINLTTEDVTISAITATTATITAKNGSVLVLEKSKVDVTIKTA